MKHIKIEIVANEHQQEELIALFDDASPTGFEQTDETLIAYFAEDDYRKNEITKILGGFEYTISEVGDQNWNALWERNFQPVIVADFCGVRAHFHEQISSVEYEIIITPKMSFGTGHHATTYMMMEAMRDVDFTNKSVFDFGTGTGILAILAAKRGAKKVTAIDIDEWSIENARENFERNDCKVNLQLSTTIPDDTFDIVLANINRNVILDFLPEITRSLANGANLLLSGLLVADEKDITEACEKNGLRFISRNERQGWISLLFVLN